MKRAWTKKVKNLASGAVDENKLAEQLQLQPKVKRRILRTSAAIIGLIVSVGTQNLLLAQAAQLPEGTRSESALIKDSAALATVEVVPTVMPVPAVTSHQADFPSTQRDTVRQSTGKKAVILSYNQPDTVVQSALGVNFTVGSQSSSRIAAQAPGLEQDVGVLLRQHRQTVLKQTQALVNYLAPVTVKSRVATTPANINNSEESLVVQQIAPELPPLAPILNYLPEPNSVAPFNSLTPFNKYIWPAKGALTSKYGYRWGRMHRGIDIAAPVGTPIFAAAPGVVIKSGWNKGGYGNLVDIQHPDGTLTRYAHNYRLLVQPGQFVEQGQQISLMGSTGRSTGSHLHFEVHRGGKGAVNPIALLPKSK